VAIAFNTLYSQLVTLAKATWPDILEGSDARLWEVDHVASISFDALKGDGPFCVIVFPAPLPIAMGEANRCYQLPVEFWWIAATTQGSETHRERAEEMASALWAEGRTPASVTVGQVWSDPMPRPYWGVGLPINQLLRAKKDTHLAAGAGCMILAGETAE
jgi:hypothetical protein